MPPGSYGALIVVGFSIKWARTKIPIRGRLPSNLGGPGSVGNKEPISKVNLAVEPGSRAVIKTFNKSRLVSRGTSSILSYIWFLMKMLFEFSATPLVGAGLFKYVKKCTPSKYFSKFRPPFMKVLREFSIKGPSLAFIRGFSKKNWLWGAGALSILPCPFMLKKVRKRPKITSSRSDKESFSILRCGTNSGLLFRRSSSKLGCDPQHSGNCDRDLAPRQRQSRNARATTWLTMSPIRVISTTDIANAVTTFHSFFRPAERRFVILESNAPKKKK